MKRPSARMAVSQDQATRLGNYFIQLHQSLYGEYTFSPVFVKNHTKYIIYLQLPWAESSSATRS